MTREREFDYDGGWAKEVEDACFRVVATQAVISENLSLSFIREHLEPLMKSVGLLYSDGRLLGVEGMPDERKVQRLAVSVFRARDFCPEDLEGYYWQGWLSATVGDNTTPDWSDDRQREAHIAGRELAQKLGGDYGNG